MSAGVEGVMYADPTAAPACLGVYGREKVLKNGYSPYITSTVCYKKNSKQAWLKHWRAALETP
jgi:hypothetical protein